MKFIFVLLILSSLTACDNLKNGVGTGMISGNHALITKRVIIVMAGQSNMLGSGQSREYPHEENVQMTYVGGNPYAFVGPGTYAALLYAGHHPDTQVIGVMCAVGSTSINQWAPGSILLESCLSRVRTIRDAQGAKVIGMFWYQGEQDAAQTPVDLTWSMKLRTIITYTASKLDIETLNTVYAQLGLTDDMSYITSWNEFKAHQYEAAQCMTSMITTEDQPIIAHLHHDYEANAVIGSRFYNRMLEWTTGG